MNCFLIEKVTNINNELNNHFLLQFEVGFFCWGFWKLLLTYLLQGFSWDLILKFLYWGRWEADFMFVPVSGGK